MLDYWKGDAFEILPNLPDNEFDVIITDPPYDFKLDEKEFIHKELLRVSKGTIIVFSPPENQWILPADQYLFWLKPPSTKNTSRRYSRFVEIMFVYREGTWNTKRHWSQYTNVFKDLVDDASIHPFRKPPSLIERLVLNHTNEGDKVLDPFGGSFVVAEVCDRFGRHCLSIEKDESRFT